METIRFLILCGTILALAMLVLVSLPQSKLRDCIMPVVGWGFALFCGLYVLSPIDIVPEALLGPFGVVDDVGAVILGVASARSAMSAAKRQALEWREDDSTASEGPRWGTRR